MHLKTKTKVTNTKTKVTNTNTKTAGLQLRHARSQVSAVAHRLFLLLLVAAR